jgi:hypothetical protein
MKQMSIVGKNYHSDEEVVAYYNVDRMKYWGKQGAFWGALSYQRSNMKVLNGACPFWQHCSLEFW